VKCIFDSSASVNMMTTIKVCVTITTVMSTKFISRSHYICIDVDVNTVDTVRNVFVQFLADDVAIICEFCRSESLI
jgi:hypothetical protein